MPSDNAIKLAALAASLIIVHAAITKMHDLSSKALDKANDGGKFPRHVTAKQDTPRAQGNHGSHMHVCQGLNATGGSVSVAFSVVPIFHKAQ